jgi:uncharacterized protein
MTLALRTSRYNVLAADPRSGRPVVFNGVSGRLLPVEPRVAAALRDGAVARLLPGERVRLARAGVLVQDPAEETACLERRYERILAPDPVSTFVISPTGACNLRCPYCYQQAMTPRPAAMSAQTAERVTAFVLGVMSAPEKTQAVVKFYGGEPLLALERCRAMAARLDEGLSAAGKRLFTWIHTNGTLLGPELFEPAFPALGCVEMTIDGPRRLHDTVRVGPAGRPTFARIASSARLAAKHATTVVLRINARGADELREALDDLAAEGLLELPGVSFYDGRVSDCFAEFTRGDEAAAQELEIVRSSLEVRRMLDGSPWRERYQVYPIFSKYGGVCAFSRPGNFCIDPHGDLYLCIFQQGVPEYRVGRLGEGGRPELLPEYEEILARSPFRHAQCAQCACLPLCWGGCFAKAFAQKRSFSAPFCGAVRETTPARIAAGLAGGEL